MDLETRTPQQLGEAVTASPAAVVAIQEPEGPVEKMKLERLFGRFLMVDATYETKAELDADLAHDANAIGLVYADPAAGASGYYLKTGASGAGAWVLTRLTKGDKGDPGGTDYSIGLFADAAGMAIPIGVDLVAISGTNATGDAGAGQMFVFDAAVDAAYVIANPTTSFLDSNDRGFSRVLDQTRVTLEDFGGGTGGTGAENLAAFERAFIFLTQMGGGIIKLGVGTYNVEKTNAHLLIPTNIQIHGAGKYATRLVRADTFDPPGQFFKLVNPAGNLFRDMTVVGNNLATNSGNGALFYVEMTAAATSICHAPTFEDMAFENCKGDGWLWFIMVGNPAYDMMGPTITRVTATGGSSRGPGDLGIPNGFIRLWGPLVPGGTSRIRNTLIANIDGDIPKVKSIVIAWGGVDTLLHHDIVFEHVGTDPEILDDKAAYGLIWANETINAPNPDNIIYSRIRIKYARSAGIYSAAWGGRGGRVYIFDVYVHGVTDTLGATRPKAALAFTDSNTKITVDGLHASQCVAGIDAPMAAGGSITVRNILVTNYKATVSTFIDPEAGLPVGNGSLTLDPDDPVLPGAVAGEYSVLVTEDGGTATPTFTVKRPDGVTVVGTYTVGGAGFATETKFTAATGTVHWGMGEGFYVKVEELQPIDGSFGIRLGKQPSVHDVAPSGTIRAENLTILSQATDGDGLIIPSTDGNGDELLYGKIFLAGHRQIEVHGTGIKMWGASEDATGPLLNAYQGGVFVSGTDHIVSTGGKRGLLIRATPNRIEWNAHSVIERSSNTAIVAAAQVDLRGCQDFSLHGSITMAGQGAHVDDAEAWDATDWQLDGVPTFISTKGALAVDAVHFRDCDAGFRAKADSLGTTGATYDWTPAGKATVANIDPVAGEPLSWTYISSWLPQGITALAQVAAQADTTAADLAGLKVDFNALLAKMRTAHVLDT